MKIKQLISSRQWLIVVALILITLIAAITIRNNHNHTSQPEAIVQITESGFTPATLKIKAGTVVKWVNLDQKNHQVASNPYPSDNDLPGLKSKLLASQGNYSFTFKNPGNFGYHDDLSPTINGVILVEK